MAKNLVLTGSIGHRPFTNITLTNLEKYAEKCGADFIVERDATIPENLKSIEIGRGDNKAYLNKILWIRKHLENYEKVFWLDDTCFVNLEICPNVFDMVPQGYVAGAPESVERWTGFGQAFPSFMKQIGYTGNMKDVSYNTGVIMFTHEMRHIYSDENLLSKPVQFCLATSWPQQTTTDYLLVLHKIPRVTLDSKFNRMRFWPKLPMDVTYEEVIGENEEGKPIKLSPFPEEDMDSISREKLENNRYAYEAFIYHMTSVRSNEERCRVARELLFTFDPIKHWRKEIQISQDVIVDIFSNLKKDTKMLVFGLGWDSKMWYTRNKNTYFVENKEEFIELNEKDIPKENIIKYDYNNITIEKSFDMSDKEIEKFVIPKELEELGPFDIILIDGPEGYALDKPGRLIPFYWSTKLSKKGTLIYADDINRKLETYCLEKYFKYNKQSNFPERSGCQKIYYIETI